MTEIKLIDHTSKKWLWSHLNTEEEVNEVCEYLMTNNLSIKLDSFRDGCRVYLEGIDLSINGCCFSGNNLLLHVRYFRRFIEISKSQDYLDWLEKFNKYSIVRKYITERKLPDLKETDFAFKK
jgi:hypothetical protein